MLKVTNYPNPYHPEWGSYSEAIATIVGLSLNIDISNSNAVATVAVAVRPSIGGVPIDVPPTNDTWTTGQNFPDFSLLMANPDFAAAFVTIKNIVDQAIKASDPRYSNAEIS